MVHTQLQLTVKDILQRPLFQKAEAIASETALNRQVSWVHIMEVPQVGRLLNGHELILHTGIGWPDNEELSLSFLQQLIANGASGLCIELGTYSKPPLERMKELALRENFPLIFFHEQVRYIDITQDLHAYFIHERIRLQDDEELNCNRQNHWVSEWLTGEWPQHEVQNYLLKFDPAIKINQLTACVLAYPAALQRTHDLDLLLLQKQLNAHPIFENEGFVMLSTVIQTRVVIIFLDQLASVSSQERMLRTIRCLQLKQPNQVTKAVPFLIGIGKTVHEPSNMKESYSTALETIEVQQSTGPLAKPFYHELHVAKIIHAMKQTGVLNSLIEEYLGGLLRYDREKNSQLVKTLKIYLALSGSKQETAKELFIVRQTLYHRLDKIAALLGEDYMDPHKRLAIELALHGYESMYGVIA